MCTTAGDELSARVRGGAVGATTVALAVAAHGAAGGGLPAGSTLVLLVGTATVLAALTAAVPVLRRGTAFLPVVLATGQVLSHLTLAVGGGHHPADPVVAGGPMLAAHGLALLVCAGLIAAAERIGPASAAALRAVVAVRLARIDPVGPAVSAPVAVRTRPLAEMFCRTGLPRRGPPVLV
ncbi:hypothetical protein [Rhodococcus sp. NPDC003348]